MAAPLGPAPLDGPLDGHLWRPLGGAFSALLAAGWLAGLAVQLQQARLVDTGAAGAMVVCALIAAAALWRWRRALPVALALAACVAVLAFGLTTLRAATQLAERLPATLEGVDLLVTGVVAELPRQGPTGTRFVLETEAATLRGEPVRLPPRLSLGWYRSSGDDPLLAGPAETIRAGQRWQMTVRLAQPHGSLNPHGFDFELWLFERGIGAGGSVRLAAGAAPRKLEENAGHPVERLRQSVRDAIARRVDDAGAAGVLAALAVGDQAAIDREGWDVFRVTGVAHLMSISGLHVTLFAWLVGGVIAALWRRHPRLPLWLPAPQAGRVGGLAAAAAYALLAGWGVPAQRTVGMIAVVVAMRAVGLRWPLHAVLLAVAVAVTAADPWAMLQPGFWLSFVAVALLVASDPAQEREPAQTAASDGPALTRLGSARLLSALRDGLRTQFIATIGLAPLTLVFFQQLSLVGFAANLVAIPLVTFLITPLALAGMLLPPLWLLAGLLVQGLTAFLQMLAALPQAQWTAPVAPAWIVAAGLLGGLLAVLPLPWRLRLLALPLALPLLVPPVTRPAPGQFELVAADVGQGTAVLVRTRGHLLLFDAGPAYSPEADAGGRVLLPLLRARGERQVDLLMLSHRDADHVGGAATLLAGLPVAALSSSLEDGHPLLATASGRGTRLSRCAAGQRWAWDGVRFEVLHPQPADYTSAPKPNALSCVVRVQGDKASALLTGDIEFAQEMALLQRAGAALRSDVLQVPHHGSRTSSGTAFIGAVAPGVALVQAGYRSRFGHPAPEVVLRYEAQGAVVVRSDRCGAWTLPPDGPPRCERSAARRYWHHGSADVESPDVGSP